MSKYIVKMGFAEDVSDSQRETLLSVIGHDRELYMRQEEVRAVYWACVFIALSFVSKSFFDEFFKQAGKDAYEWAKIKLGLSKAKKEGQLKTQYNLSINNIEFFDDPFKDIEERHESILNAVHTALKIIDYEKMDETIRIGLVYDKKTKCYTEANLYEIKQLGDLPEKPFKKIQLSNQK